MPSCALLSTAEPLSAGHETMSRGLNNERCEENTARKQATRHPFQQQSTSSRHSRKQRRPARRGGLDAAECFNVAQLTFEAVKWTDTRVGHGFVVKCLPRHRSSTGSTVCPRTRSCASACQIRNGRQNEDNALLHKTQRLPKQKNTRPRSVDDRVGHEHKPPPSVQPNGAGASRSSSAKNREEYQIVTHPEGTPVEQTATLSCMWCSLCVLCSVLGFGLLFF